MPFSFAAIWARRSAILVAGAREGNSAAVSRRSVSSSRSLPFSTSSQLSISTPSSSVRVLPADALPPALLPRPARAPPASTPATHPRSPRDARVMLHRTTAPPPYQGEPWATNRHQRGFVAHGVPWPAARRGGRGRLGLLL